MASLKNSINTKEERIKDIEKAGQTKYLAR